MRSRIERIGIAENTMTQARGRLAGLKDLEKAKGAEFKFYHATLTYSGSEGY